MSWHAVAEHFHELYQALTGESPERQIEALAARNDAVRGRRYARPASVD